MTWKTNLPPHVTADMVERFAATLWAAVPEHAGLPFDSEDEDLAELAPTLAEGIAAVLGEPVAWRARYRNGPWQVSTDLDPEQWRRTGWEVRALYAPHNS